MSDININNKYTYSEDIVAREIEGELIIVPLIAGIGDLEDELFTLNDTGKAIWKLLDGTKTLGEIIQTLEQEYSVSHSEIQTDVLGIVQELVQRKMLIALTRS